MTRGRKRLTKSHDAVVAGVCGGIAEFLGWQPRGIRYLWAGMTLLTGGVGGILVYALLAIAMPEAGEGGRFRLEDFRTQ